MTTSGTFLILYFEYAFYNVLLPWYWRTGLGAPLRVVPVQSSVPLLLARDAHDSGTNVTIQKGFLFLILHLKYAFFYVLLHITRWVRTCYFSFSCCVYGWFSWLLRRTYGSHTCLNIQSSISTVVQALAGLSFLPNNDNVGLPCNKLCTHCLYPI